jgi:hypothetical protein
MPGVVRKRRRCRSERATYPSERHIAMPRSVHAPGEAGAAPTSRAVFACTDAFVE